MTDRENITVPNNKLSGLALLQITAMQPAQGREFTNALWKKHTRIQIHLLET